MIPATGHTDPPGQADERVSPATPPSDADLLQGLGALADLISNASETLNQCLLTIEGKLGALPVAKEEWVPIRTARSAIEPVPRPDEEQASQERVFGGVPVTIMKFGAPAPPPGRRERCQWQYELGYTVAGHDWTLMIRAASFTRSDGRDAEISDLMPLRDAPLEIRLKAIREIPDLIQLLDARCAEAVNEALASISPVSEDAGIMHQAAF